VDKSALLCSLFALTQHEWVVTDGTLDNILG
jgi:hypothetical protein